MISSSNIKLTSNKIRNDSLKKKDIIAREIQKKQKRKFELSRDKCHSEDDDLDIFWQAVLQGDTYKFSMTSTIFNDRYLEEPIVQYIMNELNVTSSLKYYRDNKQKINVDVASQIVNVR